MMPIARKLAINEKEQVGVGTTQAWVEAFEKEVRSPVTRAKAKLQSYDASGSVESRLKRVERSLYDLVRHISFLEKKSRGSVPRE